MSSTESHRLVIWRQLISLLKDPSADPQLSERQWEAVVSLADRLRLAPLLDYVLRGGSVQVSKEQNARLHRAARRGTLARILAEQTLAEAQTILAQEDIRFIVLKGLSLGYSFYPTPDCRPMSDLDLVVHAVDREKATQAMTAAGWRVIESDNGELSAGLELIKSEPGLLPIELHWELMHFEWFSQCALFRADDIWASVISCQAAQPAFLMLAPEDSLVYLSLHLAIHHAFEEMWLLIDIDRLVGAGDLDWDRVTKRAIDGQVANAVYFTLTYAQRLLDTPVPTQVMKQLRPSRPTIWLVERLAPAERSISERQTLGPQALRVLHFLLVDRPNARFQGIARAFFPGRSWLVRRYGPADTRSVLAYSLWHPIRIAGLGLKATSQLVSAKLRRGIPPVQRNNHA